MAENKGYGYPDNPVRTRDFEWVGTVREMTAQEEAESQRKRADDTDAAIERIHHEPAIARRVAELRHERAIAKRVAELRREAATDRRSLPYPVLRGHGFDH